MLVLVRSFFYTSDTSFSEEFYTPDAGFSEDFLLHSSSWF